MSLKHAVLASLLDGEASGYDLARRMDVSVANFWHALPTQIYAELRRLEADGLVVGREVAQDRRPNKRLYAVSPAGRDELARFTQEAARPTSIKDDLLIKIQAADVGDLEAVADAVEERWAAAALRLRVFEELVARFLGDRDEEEYLRSARRIGPYLNLCRGRDFERENLEWYRWAADALRRRSGGEHPPPPDAPDPRSQDLEGPDRDQ